VLATAAWHDDRVHRNGDGLGFEFHAPYRHQGHGTDNAGNTWRFNYHNNTRLLNDAGDVQVVDHFNLVGNGGVLHLHSHFVIVFRANGDVEVKQVTGDPEGCDPI
jgi:hypothetical protein